MPILSLVEQPQRVDEALAGLADQVRGGNAAVLERQLGGVGGAHAELVLLAPGAEALRAALDHDRGDALLAGGAIGHRQHHRGVGDAAVRDEVLGAVQHEVVAVPHGGRAHPAGVGPRARLGEPPAAHLLAAGERRQPALLLLRAAEEMDVRRAQAVVRGERQRDPGVDARELLHHDRPVERREPRAAVLLGPAGAREPERAEPREHLARELLLLVPLARVRGELGLGELAHGLAQQELLFAQLEVHAPPGQPSQNGSAVSWYTAIVALLLILPVVGASRWIPERHP